jgi:hypothetical protein
VTHPLPWQLVEGYVTDATGEIVFAVAPVECFRAPDEETARFIVECVNQSKGERQCP